MSHSGLWQSSLKCAIKSDFQSQQVPLLPCCTCMAGGKTVGMRAQTLITSYVPDGHPACWKLGAHRSRAATDNQLIWGLGLGLGWGSHRGLEPSLVQLLLGRQSGDCWPSRDHVRVIWDLSEVPGQRWQSADGWSVRDCPEASSRSQCHQPKLTINSLSAWPHIKFKACSMCSSLVIYTTITMVITA